MHRNPHFVHTFMVTSKKSMDLMEEFTAQVEGYDFTYFGTFTLKKR